MYTLDALKNMASQISRDLGQEKIQLASVAAALFQDTNVYQFLKESGLTDSAIAELQTENQINIHKNNPPSHSFGYQFSIAGQDNYDDSQSDLKETDAVKKLFENAQNVVNTHAPHSEQQQGLIALYFLLNRDPDSKTVTLFSEHGISSTTISKKITALNSQITSRDLISLPHISTTPKYQYIIPKGANTALSKYTTCLNDAAYEGKLAPTVGREDEIKNVLRTLRRKSKSNPLLLGKAGVGKTAIAEGIAQLAFKKDLPDDVDNIKIFQLDLTELIAGTMYRGDFESRIKEVIEEIQKIDGAILFIDEIHNVIGAGRAGGSMDVSNILKPAMARGEISVMGATTYNEYRQYIEKDEAFDRRFGPIQVLEPSLEEAKKILSGIKKYYEMHHDCIITDDAIDAAVEMSAQYITDRNLPDKAIDLMDLSGAILQELPEEALVFDEDGIPIMTKDIIAHTIAKKTGLPLDRITASDKEIILSLEQNLNGAVFDQSDAVKALSDAYIVSRSGIGEPDQPLGSFLFTGPTGVGKTELTTQLAEHLNMNFLRLDMSEYSERHSISKLIGAPPGYVGYDQGALLTDPVNRKPNTVILLDEIEKAHPDIFNLLLQVMDNGMLTDSTGKTVNFRNTLLIMTSNAGYSSSIANNIGFGTLEKTDHAAEELEHIFSPEFRNRLDGIIPFNRLSKKVMPKIVGKITEELNVKLQKRGISLTMTDGATNWLIEKGFDDQMGARPLKRIFKEHVQKPIARALIVGDDSKLSGIIRVDRSTDADELSFSFEDNPAVKPAAAATPTGPRVRASTLDIK